MELTDRGKRKLLVFLAASVAIILVINLSLLSGADVRSTFKYIPIRLPVTGKESGQTVLPDPNLPKLPSWHEDDGNFEDVAIIDDEHPIVGLMRQADTAWNEYEDNRSTTFKETVAKYRRKYGRHPPPAFRDWYKFARERNVHNIDDFEQIMDDLRPFWGVQPATLRSYGARLSEDPVNGVSGLHIRAKKVWKLTNANWRVETLAQMVEPFIEFLPDMDIAMNILDQPRIVVPWDDMQKLLKIEESTRHVSADPIPQWSQDPTGLLKENDTEPLLQDPNFFTAHGQQYMKIAREACPPESHARSVNSSAAAADELYKFPVGGFVNNFNRSSDLCTVGPEIEDKHGFLFAPSTIIPSRELLPIFGECKVNVNSDILFPANMYYRNDQRYEYDPTFDYEWDDKLDSMIWRGVTSGGTNTADNWKKMHRQRLVLLSNGTELASTEVKIMVADPSQKGSYLDYDHFNPSKYATDHTDVGFTGGLACVPDCSFYDDVWTYKNETSLSQQFMSKFVVDVDGHSFSGRWHAFLKSKSLGIKSTIFREWHDSRLFAWRHFVPLDNRYDELYAILTYFTGVGTVDGKSGDAYMPRHDFEGRKLGRQGREWAAKVLRKEDIEIYAFRLMIEWARIVDDNRDRIGYSQDGSELDKYDAKNSIGASNGAHW